MERAPKLRVLLVLDYAAVLVFVVIGRAVHGHVDSVAGIARTAWPFLVGTLVGQLGSRAWRHPLGWTAVVVWIATVGVGMVLRVVVGQGIAFPFVLVALGFFALTQLGWRLAAGGVVAWRHERASS